MICVVCGSGLGTRLRIFLGAVCGRMRAHAPLWSRRRERNLPERDWTVDTLTLSPCLPKGPPSFILEPDHFLQGPIMLALFASRNSSASLPPSLPPSLPLSLSLSLSLVEGVSGGIGAKRVCVCVIHPS